jgi:hypothetical protein
MTAKDTAPKTAQIVSVGSADAQGFRWAWRSSDGKKKSATNFAYFYECVEDARAAGYTVELSGTIPRNVDGSPHGPAS